MPFQRAGGDLPQVIMQATQLFLQAHQNSQRNLMQLAQMKEEQKRWEQRQVLDQKVMDLREKEMTLKQDLANKANDLKSKSLALQERGMNLRESLGMANLNLKEQQLTLDQALGAHKIQYETAKLKGMDAKSVKAQHDARRAEFQKIEEDAALRPDAPLQYQSYSDTAKLLQYKNQRAAALDRLKQDATFAQPGAIDEATKELQMIDGELMQRAKYKRDHLGGMGVTASVDQTRNYLPDMMQAPQTEESGPQLPKTGSTPLAPVANPTSFLDLDNTDVLQKSILSALGRDSTFDPNTAKMGLYRRNAELKARPGGAAQAQQFRIQIFNALPAKDNNERVALMKQLGLN